MKNNIWKSRVVTDENGDLCLELPNELLKKMKWNIGSTLEFFDNADGTWSIKIVKFAKFKKVFENVVQFFRKKTNKESKNTCCCSAEKTNL